MQSLKKYTLISIGLLGISVFMTLYQSSCAFQPDLSDSNMQPIEERVTIFKGDTPENDLKRQQRITQALHHHSQALFQSNSPFKGPQNSEITLVVFFDYQCSHCKMMTPVLDTLQAQNHTLKIVYKELPILGDTSLYAAKAALAAQKQGKYNLFGTQLMQTEQLSKKEILNIAQNADLNIAQLERDINSEKIDKEIKQNVDLAKALTIKGTPVILLVNEQVPNTVQGTSQAFFITGNADLITLQDLVNKLKAL